MKLYKRIAQALNAYKGNHISQEVTDAWTDVIARCNDELPSGSGFDSGSKVNIDLSTPEKIVIDTAFHHMDNNGYYCGWSHITVTVRASLQFDFDIKINFHGYKRASNDSEYFYDTFNDVLSREVDIPWKRLETVNA